jgi:spore germination protein GerM
MTTVQATSTVPPDQADTVEVMVYLLGGPDVDTNDCSAVAPVARSVESATTLAGALEALLAGPTDAERSAGYDSWFSSETEWAIENVTVSSGVARIDFTEDSPLINNASTSCGSMSFLAQLDSTVTQFPSVDRTVYSFGGDIDAFYEWLQLSPPES